MATKKLTPVKRKPSPVVDSDIEEVAAPKAKAKTTKAIPKVDDSSDTALSVQKEILAELKTQTEYIHRMDWKLWVIMGMIKLIGEENGYTFKSHEDDDEREIDTPNSIHKLADKDGIPWEQQGNKS
jgi:hypothetical protein